MEFKGEIKDISRSLDGTVNITLTCKDNSILREYDKLKDKDLRIKLVQWREKRSLNANAYLWVLLGKIAEVLRVDKWDIYLKMLKAYGQYTYIAVKPNVVDAVKAQWREVEELGELEINGQKAIQLLCYFGSSTYNTKEMSVLLDGVVHEAKELEIETLTLDELERIKSAWQNQ